MVCFRWDDDEHTGAGAGNGGDSGLSGRIGTASSSLSQARNTSTTNGAYYVWIITDFGQNVVFYLI